MLIIIIIIIIIGWKCLLIIIEGMLIIKFHFSRKTLKIN